jgi:hypothetical protein
LLISAKYFFHLLKKALERKKLKEIFVLREEILLSAVVQERKEKPTLRKY